MLVKSLRFFEFSPHRRKNPLVANEKRGCVKK